MRGFHNDPDNAYILIRVFNIENEGRGVKFFPDPWGLYMSRVLDFISKEGYRVCEVDESQETYIQVKTEEDY